MGDTLRHVVKRPDSLKEAGAGAPMTIKNESSREMLARRIDRLAKAVAEEEAEARRNGSAPNDPLGRPD